MEYRKKSIDILKSFPTLPSASGSKGENGRDTIPVSILTGGNVMKKILSLVLAAALSAALFTGCGCEANVSDHPGGMITEEATVMPRPTATHATEPKQTHATEPKATTLPPATDETGMTGESSLPTDTTSDPRARNRNTVR